MAEDTDWTSKEYDEGRAAFAEGYPKDACPYAKGTDESKAWTAGWVAADDEASL